ncbi:polygalacturonase At1g48100-like [Coffea eugenioides]|uniref:polygalacturonase At1g48100-like n=1 Tax=Coffea eugenioides TaxID=49369 RepID=UPI000F60A5E3|nr:polygalacturonase At1g48100-like [Coffea eugenioides]
MARDMKRNRNSSAYFFLLFSLILLFAFSTLSVEARKSQGQKMHRGQHKKHKNHKGNVTSPPRRSRIPAHAPASPPITESTIFDVLSFGAKGDGICDDSKAVAAAWEAACKVPGATMEFPSEFKFLIKPITLQGPCQPHLTLQIDGLVLAPSKVWSGPKSSLFQWINFKWLQNFTIQGSGIVDGQGSNWWTPSSPFDSMKRPKTFPDMKPTALRFYSSYNVTVRDIKIINSPNCHLKFDNSRGVRVNNITISAPETSLNTDGIHLQNSQDVEIHHSNIGCGDDCVSIQTGCSNVFVHHINCGPGHGISLGGLGKGGTVACVSNIIVDSIFMNNTLYGARIKTWQGGLGAVKNVSFSNIKVSDVKVPIMIDQYYCDKHICKNKTGAVAISGVKFDQITGTYSAQPLHLACSSSVPCSNVDLSAINLQPSLEFRGLRDALCWNSYGKSQAPLVPTSIDYCLLKGGSVLQKISRSHGKSC